MPFIRTIEPGPLDFKFDKGLMGNPRVDRIGRPKLAGVTVMQDLIWIGIVLGLLAASLAYIRLCDNA